MYTTIYNDYSQSDLLSLFSTSTWNSLSYGQRTQACQEVENRYAAENNVEPCLIMTEPMNGSCYGYYIDNTIYLNEGMLRDGVFTTTYTDENGNTQTIQTGVLAPSWNTLDTVYHEGTHGVQESQGRMPDTYIGSNQDHDLYRIQGIEKEAYAVGQLRTLDALSTVEKTTGELDPSRNDYIASVRADSFQEALQQASLNYNDENIEATLAAVISDRELGIQPENPSESYIAINDLCDDYNIQRASDIQLRNEAREPNQTQENETRENNETQENQMEENESEREDSVTQQEGQDYENGESQQNTQSQEGGQSLDDSDAGLDDQSQEDGQALDDSDAGLDNQSQEDELSLDDSDAGLDSQSQEDELSLDDSDARLDTQDHEDEHTQQGALNNTESSHSAEYDDGYSASDSEYSQSQQDSQSLDDGFSNNTDSSSSYSGDYDDGYSASGSAGYSADGPSVSDGIDNSSDGGMSDGPGDSMDME